MSGADAPLHNGAELDWMYNPWLGCSQYAADLYLTGSIDDLVIHGGVLSGLGALERYRAIFADGFDSGDASAWVAIQP